MVNGLYSAAAGMYSQQTWIDALSSDIARLSAIGLVGAVAVIPPGKRRIGRCKSDYVPAA
jgi:hypothetical protein